MKLIEKFRHNFSVDDMIAGQQIFAQQEVQLVQSSNTHLVAEIHNKDFAECSISVQKNTLKLECDCEDFQSNGTCSHLLASLLQADKQEVLSQAAKRSVKKDFPKDNNEVQEEPEPYDKPTALSAADQLKALRSGKDKTSFKSIRHLKKLPQAKEITVNGTQSSSSAKDYKSIEIFYLITLSHCQDFQHLHISTFWKQDGQSKPFNFNHQQSFTDNTDAQIFAILATDFVDPAFRKNNRFLGKDANEFLVSQFNCEALLPILQNSKRCFVRTAPTRTDVKKLVGFPESFQFSLDFKRDDERNYLISGNSTVQVSNLIYKSALGSLVKVLDFTKIASLISTNAKRSIGSKNYVNKASSKLLILKPKNFLKISYKTPPSHLKSSQKTSLVLKEKRSYQEPNYSPRLPSSNTMVVSNFTPN